jgi:hypothetical protein
MELQDFNMCARNSNNLSVIRLHFTLTLKNYDNSFTIAKLGRTFALCKRKEFNLKVQPNSPSLTLVFDVHSQHLPRILSSHS